MICRLAAGAVCVIAAVAQTAVPSAPTTAPRPRLGTTSLRNENVAIYQIDNNAVKEANVRIGTRATVSQFNVLESNYFAAEHGQAPTEALLLPAVTARPSWHADLFANHQNSVANARTFFQVGPVKPSRKNHYGFRGTGEAPRVGFFTFSGFNRKIRGMVNGNVLVPLAGERTPLATDPAVRQIVQRFLDAYPDELPNRLDFDPRALNTNAPQSIDEVDGVARLDRPLSATSQLSLTYTLNRQHTDAFKFVKGQNPNTDIHSHRAKATYRKSFSAATELVVGASFQRTRSALLPDPGAVGPRVRFGYQIEELGPDSQFPIDRAQNSFRYGSQLAHTAGSHSLVFGADARRYQLNGIETNNARGYFQFTNNFGRQAIENLRFGTPSTYEVTLGELARGFRTWAGAVYMGDRWRVSPKLQLSYGVRWSLEGAPSEVNGRDTIAYDCDCNNVSPRVGIALQLPHGWMLRTASAISFAPIQPVTYQQVRNNVPLVRYIQRQNPDLADPLGGVDILAGRVSPTILSPDLTSAYAFQHNLTVEKQLFGRLLARVGYVRSRSVKLINYFVTNRAEAVPGIPLVSATVDQRRADPSFYEVKTIVNAGLAYFDAGVFSLELPLTRGLLASATYTFSKAIDEGSDFTSTAANRDLLSSRSQSQYDSLSDRRGLSNFDAPHSLSVDWSWQPPRFGGWQFSGAALFKSGTPLTVYIGSDTPGFGNVDGSSSDRPHILDPSILGTTISHPNEAPLILRRDRFSYMVPGEQRGSVGRNTFRKARIANTNAAISRQWVFRGRREWSAMFRVEAYNLTNTPQFDEPQRNLTSPSFGRITNTLNDGRVFQLSLRATL